MHELHLVQNDNGYFIIVITVDGKTCYLYTTTEQDVWCESIPASIDTGTWKIDRHPINFTSWIQQSENCIIFSIPYPSTNYEHYIQQHPEIFL